MPHELMSYTQHSVYGTASDNGMVLHRKLEADSFVHQNRNELYTGNRNTL